MIPVDTKRLAYRLPPGWLTKAARLQRKLDEAASPQDARKILESNGHWRELNQVLREASNQKCWYSETRPITSRMDVDHFRPKGTVRESNGSTRPGYPFMAYDFRNYRLSAQLMNQRTRNGEESRGKHDQFPLLAGSSAATDLSGVAGEKPLLLDPTVPGDPDLLTFDEGGKPRAAVKAAEDPVGHERAERTIDVLWLDGVLLTDNRKVAWREVHEAVVRAERCEKRAKELTAAGNLQEAATEWGYFRSELSKLRSKAGPTEEFSAVVRTCLRTCGRPWALQIAERTSRLPLVISPTAACPQP
ncbi:MAG: hypothetical protein ACLGG5_05325 [Thermoleophilia bacterium]